MKRCFGVEMKNMLNVKINNLELFFREMYTIVNICAEHEQLMIVETKEEQQKLTEYLDRYHCLEGCYSLYYLEKSEQKELFFDYGFIADEYGLFLYQEFVTPFLIKAGKDEQITMALMQIEEDLIAIEYGKSPIYFIEKQKVELIKKYAEAYEITVEFLEYFGQTRQKLF